MELVVLVLDYIIKLKKSQSHRQLAASNQSDKETTETNKKLAIAYMVYNKSMIEKGKRPRFAAALLRQFSLLNNVKCLKANLTSRRIQGRGLRLPDSQSSIVRNGTPRISDSSRCESARSLRKSLISIL